jgi:hypothetical protein
MSEFAGFFAFIVGFLLLLLGFAVIPSGPKPPDDTPKE